MTKLTIRYIQSVANYRMFQNWRPGSDENRRFARVNLIYGHNGSGKSTFANLIRGCVNGDAEARQSGLVLGVEDAQGAASKVAADNADDAFWSRLHVFNRGFIAENLAFEAPDGPNPHALLTLGKIGVDALAELEVLRPRLDAAVQQLREAEETGEDAQKLLKDRLRDVARGIAVDLNGVDVPGYDPRTYNGGTLRGRIEEVRKKPGLLVDAPDDPSADRSTAKMSAMAPLKLPNRDVVADAASLSVVRELLGREVVVKVIESLRGQPERSAWVQRGLDLHDGLDECLFCGGTLGNERRDDLAAHFDTSLRDLQAGITNCVDALKASVAASRDYLNALPSEDAVYPELRSVLRAAREAYRKETDALEATVSSLVDALQSKRDNPFGTPAIAEDLTLEMPGTAQLESVAERHSQRISSHDRESLNAARRVELYHIQGFVGEYERLVEDEKAAQKKRVDLGNEVTSLRKRIVALENVDSNPVPGASELTASVARLLGREELAFTPTRDGRSYAIERNGVPALNLSEGEQTAIALLYFLISVREDKIEGDEPIVIIDDPVSSLDQGILYGVSAQIWTELVDNEYVAQMFLLTHNFELFRQWLIQLSVKRGRNGETCDFKAYEMNAVYENRKEGPARCSKLRRWESDQKRARILRSEYHYLFYQVARATIRSRGESYRLSDQMDQLALMPNAARRMLEAFLSFRYPEGVGSFHASMQEVMNGDQRLAPMTRARIEKYLHVYSHSEGGDISSRLDLEETPTILRALFEFMSSLDPFHVASMCRALDIDEAELLGRHGELTDVAR